MFDFLFGWRKVSKCKRLMRQVQCRLVVLKNKRCSIVRQLRQDVVQLIKLGHTQIAFTMVEQIYKDERIIEVYDLLDHFCEFVVINMAYIRRHKDCPNDINEAISSLIFASARCGDIPELRRVRKLFGERYGHNYVMSALELLPSNFVNAQIRNSLSIKTVAENVKIRLWNEIFRDYNRVQGHLDSPLALEYKSEWHQEQAKDNTVGETRDVEANQNLSAKGNEILCITLPLSSPADQHLSPIKALVPVTQCPDKQVKHSQTGIPDKSKSLVLATLSNTSDELVQVQRLEDNVVYLDDIQEFQSPKSKDIINLFDQRVFIFKYLVLPQKKNIEDALHVAEGCKKSGKVCHRRSRKKSLSKEYWSFKDLSCESYYGRTKQLKNNLDYPCCHGLIKVEKTEPVNTRTMLPSGELNQSSHEVVNENRQEETMESEFYSCSDCSSLRSISMPMPSELQDTERNTCFVRHSSFTVQQLKYGNSIHPKLPDYKELESTFLALKSAYMLNKNR